MFEMEKDEGDVGMVNPNLTLKALKSFSWIAESRKFFAMLAFGALCCALLCFAVLCFAKLFHVLFCYTIDPIRCMLVFALLFAVAMLLNSRQVLALQPSGSIVKG